MVEFRNRLNFFILLKLPSAFICGVRIKSINEHICITTVRHKWINKNPFNSMYWAVQGMAAELATGALIINKINQLNKNISMLVIRNEAEFIKKGKGVIIFNCNQGLEIDNALKRVIKTNESQTITLNALGKNSNGNIVSKFIFIWSLKFKN